MRDPLIKAGFSQECSLELQGSLGKLKGANTIAMNTCRTPYPVKVFVHKLKSQRLQSIWNISSLTYALVRGRDFIDCPMAAGFQQSNNFPKDEIKHRPKLFTFKKLWNILEENYILHNLEKNHQLPFHDNYKIISNG